VLFGKVLWLSSARDSSRRSRDAVLRNQDRQLLERTKTEIRGSLGIETEVDPPQSALLSSPVPDLVSRQVSAQETPFTNAHESRGYEILLSEDASASLTSQAAPSLHTTHHSLPERQPPGEITSIQKSPVDTWRKDLGLVPPTKDKPLPASPQSSHTQSHSPSIVNLGRRSVVRMRLAEMQPHPTIGSPTSRNSRRLPPLKVTTTLPREPTGRDLKVVSGLSDAGSYINAVGLTPTTEQPMSSGSSQVASSLGGSDDRLTSPVSASSNPSTLSSRPKSVFRLRDEMRARDLTILRRHSISERSVSSPAAASPVDSQTDGTIDALLDVMDVHAERQLIKTAELNDQLDAVQNDVRNVAADVRVAISGRERDSQQLAEIHTAVGDVRSVLTRLDAKQRDDAPVKDPIDKGLWSNQAQIFQALEEIQEILRNSTLGKAVDSEVKSNVMTGEQPPALLRASHDTGAEQVDLSDIRYKIDMLLELSAQKSNAASFIPPRTDPQSEGSQVRLIFSSGQRNSYRPSRIPFRRSTSSLKGRMINQCPTSLAGQLCTTSRPV
jgi:hypothetical protein